MPSSEHAAFFAQVENHLDGLPKADRTPFWLAGHLYEFARDNIDELIHRVGGIEEVIKLVEAAYRKYVVPLDIPGVSDTYEPLVDEAAINMISVGLRKGHDLIHKS